MSDTDAIAREDIKPAKRSQQRSRAQHGLRGFKMLARMGSGAAVLAMAFVGLILTGGFQATAQKTAGVELIMLDEAGCMWCERWSDEIGGIYAKTDEGKRAPLRRISIHEPLPGDLQFLTKGSFTPTFILVQNAREIGRIRGYPGEDFFFPLLRELLERLDSDKMERGEAD